MKQIFKDACDRIKAMGYRVIVTTRPDSNYGWVSDGTHIGHFYPEWGGLFFSTYNKRPGSDCSGYAVYDKDDHDLLCLDEVTKEVIEESFKDYPSWVRDFKRVAKYKDLDEFLQTYWDKKNIKEW